MYLRVTSNLIYQIGKRIQRIKAQFSALIESPYTTLYQTVRTCHDISSDEVAQIDPIKKDVLNFEQMQMVDKNVLCAHKWLRSKMSCPPCSPKVANHDLIHLPCSGWWHFRLSLFPCNLGKDTLFQGMRTIIPSYFTTQMDMLKSSENNNRAENPTGMCAV